MNLIGYIRVSTEGQQDGVSLGEQARKIMEWATKAGHSISAIFSDADSGENIQGRKGFLAAIKHCNQGHAEGLVVANFDRYSRSSFDSELVAKIFKNKGKHLFSVEQSFDLKDKYGRFTFRVNQAVAELVREQITERMYSCRMAKVQQGGWIGHRPPFGWTCHQGEMIPEPTEQMVIRYMVRLYRWTKFAGLNDIARALNYKIESGDHRFLPKNAKAGQRKRTRPYVRQYSYLWTYESVRRILRGIGVYQEPTSSCEPRKTLNQKSKAS